MNSIAEIFDNSKQLLDRHQNFFSYRKCVLKGKVMKYTKSTLYRSELNAISDVLELINYRPRTIDSYLQSIFECCLWLDETYGIPLDNATVNHLRSFLPHLKRSKCNPRRPARMRSGCSNADLR